MSATLSPAPIATEQAAPRAWVVEWVTGDLTGKPYLCGFDTDPDAEEFYLWSRRRDRALRMTFAEADAIVEEFERVHCIARFAP